MRDREALLALIDHAYEARTRGDKEELARCWAPGATYRMVGEAGLLECVPCGPADATQATAVLIDLAEFQEMERLSALVEDNQAAIRWRVTVSVAGKPPVDTEICDFWTLDDEGRLLSLVQYCDTALLSQLLH